MRRHHRTNKNIMTNSNTMAQIMTKTMTKTFREWWVILGICDPCNLLLLVRIYELKSSPNIRDTVFWCCCRWTRLHWVLTRLSTWVSPGPLSLFSKAVWWRSLVKWLNHRAGSIIPALHNSFGWNDRWLGGRNDKLWSSELSIFILTIQNIWLVMISLVRFPD